MTVPSTPRRAGPFYGNGSTTQFPFLFKVYTRADVQFVVQQPGGDAVTLTLDVDYLVTLNADQDSSPGGTITYPISGSPLASGGVASVIGNLPYTQPTDLPDGGAYRARSVETMGDRIVMLVQQVAELLGRTFTFPPTEGIIPEFPSIADRAGKLLGFDDDGQFVGVLPAPGSATTLAQDLANTASVSKGAGQIGRGAQVINSIAALKQLSKSVPSRFVFVTGYYASGDGGGGPYALDVSDTTSADNGGTIIVAADGGRWKLTDIHSKVSVKQFGAKGDFNGTTGTDDTVAIQNAINWAAANTNTGTYGSFSPSVGTGTVYFPQGCYKVTALINIPYKVNLLGDGQTEFSYGSRIYQDTANTHTFRFDPSTGGGTISCEKLILSSTKGVGTGNLVDIVRTSVPYVNSIRFIDCTFAQPQNMAVLVTGDDIVFDNCLFDASQKSGTFVQLGTATGGCSNVRFIGCDFFNAQTSCIKFVNVSGVVVSGCTISQPNTSTKTLRVFDAISTAPTLVTDVSITGNRIQGPRTLLGANGIKNLTFTGNTVTEGGIGAGEVNHMFVFTGNCSGKIDSNYLRGTYDTANFYNDTGAINFFGTINGNTFANDGGTGDAIRCSKLMGRIGSNYFGGFTARQMGEKRATTGSPVNPGSIAAGATFGYTTTVTDATFGDTVTVGTIANVWLAQTGIDVRAFINAANTVRVEYRNPTGGAIVVAAHDISIEVTR